ncbi:hypothetical protein [Dactylosporangium matsuzakiense]|uniref:DUF1453 domain-containing protein n=1 Tax=Dactylosporangium matsuzakiense TaxID=53360 RepID=A0A9W6NJ76_9ACTN|nr:hypothetical protein [Dactylosporangium matsuzakiense]UWZ45262.1 hypothetical protein Dmats_01530 [Dactylosporangium matsuzakiense]GLK98767.1 hypothetical protein GCM10017581_005080 [Dactylosporangium matsuzakiense]
MTNVQLLAAIGLGVAFAALVISRQVRRRAVTPRGLIILPVWFLILSLLADHRMVYRLDSALAIGFFAAGVAFAVAMGFARAATLRVWGTDAGPMCEGDWRTGVLWVATIAVRVGVFLLAARLGAQEGMGEAMVFVAVTLGTQNVLLARRAGLFKPAQTPTPALTPARVRESV